MGVRCDLFCMRSWTKQSVVALCLAFSLAGSVSGEPEIGCLVL